MTDRQSTKNYTQPSVPASDTLVLGATKATSYGPRVEPYGDGIVEPAKRAEDAEFWRVYEWWPSRHAPKGGWWEWRADCDTETIARTLAEAIAGAQPAPSVPDGWKEGVEAAARLIDQKAELYAIRFGHDDMGVLSFGTGAHAEIKMDHHTGLLELADEVRAMLAAAPKPEESK